MIIFNLIKYNLIKYSWNSVIGVICIGYIIRLQYLGKIKLKKSFPLILGIRKSISKIIKIQNIYHLLTEISHINLNNNIDYFGILLLFKYVPCILD